MTCRSSLTLACCLVTSIALDGSRFDLRVCAAQDDKGAAEVLKKLEGSRWQKQKFEGAFIEFRKKGVVVRLFKSKDEKEYREDDAFVGRWTVRGQTIEIEGSLTLPNIKDPIRSKAVGKLVDSKLIFKVTYDDGSVSEDIYTQAK